MLLSSRSYPLAHGLVQNAEETSNDAIGSLLTTGGFEARQTMALSEFGGRAEEKRLEQNDIRRLLLLLVIFTPPPPRFSEGR